MEKSQKKSIFDNEKFNDLQIPVEILRRKDLTSTEKILLSEVAALDTGDGCYCGDAHFAEILNRSMKSIRNIIWNLRSKKLKTGERKTFLVNLELKSTDAGRRSYAGGKRKHHKKEHPNWIVRRLRVVLDGCLFTPKARNPESERIKMVHSNTPLKDFAMLHGIVKKGTSHKKDVAPSRKKDVAPTNTSHKKDIKSTVFKNTQEEYKTDAETASDKNLF